MEKRGIISTLLCTLTSAQKKEFQADLPEKVSQTERSISILVAGTQLFMIFLFAVSGKFPLRSARTAGYFSLYVSLFTVTAVTFVLYNHTVKRKKLQAFLWVRRSYALLLCFWVLGISFLEQMKGGGSSLSVYCYLLPTTAAMLLFSPLESLVIFGSTWVGLVVMLSIYASPEVLFGDVVNSAFVTVLSLFISFRHYRSMAVEFLDRKTIAAQVQEIQRSNDLQTRLARIDQLTGLYNRHHLHEKGYELFARRQKEGCNGMCLMMDIDYFKQYNDLYGHLQGDECLRKIAEAVQAQCDLVAATPIRYGGEEFLIIKMEPIPFDADAFTSGLQARIQQAALPREDTDAQRVTVSMGLWYGALDTVESLNQVIQCADDALYGAKRMGRNRVVHGVLRAPVAPEEPVSQEQLTEQPV